MGGVGRIRSMVLAALLCHIVSAAKRSECCQTRDQVRENVRSRGIASHFCPCPKNTTVGRVLFLLYTKESVDNPERVNSTDIRPFKSLKKDRPVIMNIHGWIDNSNSYFCKKTRKAFFHDPAGPMDVNLIFVDWSRMGSRNVYHVSRRKVKQVAEVVVTYLEKMTKYGLKLEELHILGHSLGAHLAGIVGQRVKNGRIGRITGFDPAGVLYKIEKREHRLTEESADFVDVIHTCGNVLGFSKPLGHVDFYPNGGKSIQPGCGADKGTRLCSHRRAYKYYFESMYAPEGFPAVKCIDWIQFKENKCNYSDLLLMGVNTPTTARGVYYLRTNKKPKYGLGDEGLHYRNCSSSRKPKRKSKKYRGKISNGKDQAKISGTDVPEDNCD